MTSRRASHTKVAFVSGDITLRGTLSIPAGRERRPAFVLVHGGTPEDRDGNSDRRLGGYVTSRRPELKEFARALVAAGFAVLRYDKRGVCESGGHYLSRTQTDLVNDALAATEFLRSHARVDSGGIALLGHSEGTVVSMRAAARDPRIAAIALYGAPADGILDLARWHGLQSAWRTGDDSHIAQLEAALKDAADGAASFTWFGGQCESGAWLREWANLDMSAILGDVRCPVLVAHGDKDWHVPWQSAGRIAQELTDTGNSDVTLQLFSNIDHLLRFEPGLSTPDRYLAEPDRPMEPLVLRSLTAWATRVLVRRELPHERRFGQQFLDPPLVSDSAPTSTQDLGPVLTVPDREPTYAGHAIE